MARRTKKEKALANIASHLVNRLLVARYDSLKPAPTRKATEIRTDLSETEQNFTADKRILAYAKCDNLYDNTALASILDTSIRLTIGKRGGTPLFTGADKDTMQKWFTSWKRHAGYAEGESYYEMLALILRLVKLHGDCIVWVDPILTDGKIRVFDADQICNVAIPDFERWKYEKGLPEDARQVEGVVVDGTGKVYGYFVTMLRNRYSVNISDAQFLPMSDVVVEALLAVVAELVVIAGNQTMRMELVAQHLLHEAAGRKGSHLLGEVEHHAVVHPCLCQQGNLFLECGEQLRFETRLQDLSRMAGKGDHGRFHPLVMSQ